MASSTRFGKCDYNLRSPAVKRILREAGELSEPTYEYYARPLEDNIFEWHFTVRGPPDTVFSEGYYHGRIVLPSEYPMKPPSIILLTPNGRFEVKQKICLSVSGYHPESWQPCWSIRTVLMAIIAFMPSKAEGSIGSVEYTPRERTKLAKLSHSWTCDECGPIKHLLLNTPRLEADGDAGMSSHGTSDADRQFIEKLCFKASVDSTSTHTAPGQPSAGDALPHRGKPFQHDNNHELEPLLAASQDQSDPPEDIPHADESGQATQEDQVDIVQQESSSTNLLDIAVVVIVTMIVCLLARRFLALLSLSFA